MVDWRKTQTKYRGVSQPDIATISLILSVLDKFLSLIKKILQLMYAWCRRCSEDQIMNQIMNFCQRINRNFTFYSHPPRKLFFYFFLFIFSYHADIMNGELWWIHMKTEDGGYSAPTPPSKKVLASKNKWGSRKETFLGPSTPIYFGYLRFSHDAYFYRWE